MKESPSRSIEPEEMDRLLDLAMQGFVPWSRFGLWGGGLFGAEKDWLPDVDIFRREDDIIVRADLPGLDMEDIEVSVEGDQLIIRGRRQKSQEIAEENYRCIERATGNFYRAIKLPDGVIVDLIEATYENGVLEVVIPLTESRREKKLKIPIR